MEPRPSRDPPSAVLTPSFGGFGLRYSPETSFRHWQLSGDGTWQEVKRQVVVDASSPRWLWHGKLLRTLRSLIMDGVPEDAVVEETASGDLSLRTTLGPSHVNMWDWDGKESLSFGLVMDRETAAIRGYTWEMGYDPVAHAGNCLIYREVATDGQIGVDIAVPEAIQNELNEAGG